MVTSLARLTGGAVGLAARGIRRTRRSTPGDLALRRLTTYFIIPPWIAAGFVDYLWHRHTHIETTSGLRESLIHSLMMIEAGPAILSALFFEINSGVLAGMIGLSMLHELTVLWDLALTAPRREIPAGEQVTHTFLEAPPFLVTAAAVATHWDEFQSLMQRGARPDFAIRFQAPPVPRSTVAAVFAALFLFGALPHFDELRRCFRAR